MRLMIVLPLVMILLTVFACTYYRDQAKALAKAEAFEISMGLAKDQTHMLDVALDGRFTTLEAYAHTMSMDAEFSFDSEDTLARLGAVQDGTYFFDMVLVNERGDCYGRDGYCENVADQMYFQASMRGEQAIEKFDDWRMSGQTRFVLSVPMRKDARIIGCVAGTFDEATFRELLISTALNSESHTIICDARGDIVIDWADGARAGARNLLDIVSDETTEGGVSRFALAENLRNGADGYLTYRAADGLHYGVYRPTGINDWMLVNMYPGSTIETAMLKATRIPNLIMILVTATALIMLFWVFVSERRGAGKLEAQRHDFRVGATQSGRMLRIYSVKNNQLVNVYKADRLSWKSTPEEMVELGYVAPESREAYLGFYNDMRSGKPMGAANARVKDADGEFRWFHADYTLVRDKNGKPDHAVVTVYENGEQMRRAIEYAQWNDMVASLVKQSALYIEANLTKNQIEKELGDARYLVGDQAANSIDAYVRYDIAHFVCPEDAARYREFMRRERLMFLYLSDVREDGMEVRLLSQDETRTEGWYRVTASMTRNPSDEDIKLLVTYTDIDKEKREQERLLRLSRRDFMTGLDNREAVEEKIRAAIDAADADTRLAMFMIDLDNFKKINDTYGHQKGDEMLKMAATAISDSFRAGDIIGRVGGDEFMAFVVGATEPAIRHRAEELCGKTQFCVGDLWLSATVGICVTRACNAEYARMYQVSDAALYRAKAEKKGDYYIDETDSDCACDQPAAAVPGTRPTVQMQSLMEYMDAGIMLTEVGEEIRTLYVSPSYYKVMNRDSADTPTEQILSLVYADDLARIERAAHRTAQTGAPLDEIYRVYGVDGDIAWRHIRSVRIPYNSPNPVLVSVVTDITAMKQEQQAAESGDSANA